MPALDFEALKKSMLAERQNVLSSSLSPPPRTTTTTTNHSTAPLVQSIEPSTALNCTAHSPWNFGATGPPLLPLPFPALPHVLYVSNAVSTDHETALVAAIRGAPWVELRARRLQQWGGLPGPGGMKNTVPLPPFLRTLADGLVAAGIFPAGAPPNHALVNAYEVGEGIDAHTDGPCYAPLVATLSLGDDALMRFRGREPGAPHVGEIVLRARSMVITSDTLYTDFAHEIERNEAVTVGGRAEVWNAEDADIKKGDIITRSRTRISVTLRHAL